LLYKEGKEKEGSWEKINKEIIPQKKKRIMK
jgi:hypothetical protein